MDLKPHDLQRALRDAVRLDRPGSYAHFAAVLATSTEEERSVLAKTLPATRLFHQDPTSSGGVYVLAALGHPRIIASTFDEQWRDLSDTVSDPLIAAMRGRSLDVVSETVRRLCELEHCEDLGWALGRAEYAARGLRHESVAYLRHFRSRVSPNRWESGGPLTAPEVVANLLADPVGLENEFWALFRVEGTGTAAFFDELLPMWGDVCRQLCERVAGFRERLLDETLAGQLRDFSGPYIVLHHHIHRAISPQPVEIVKRQQVYRALLTTASTSVALAQDLLADVVSEPEVDRAAIVETSSAVLVRAEKKIIKSQLALLAAIAQTEPRLAGAISDVVSPVVADLPLDLRKAAGKLVTKPRPDHALDVEPPVAVPEPRRTPLLEQPVPRLIESDDELFRIALDSAEPADSDTGVVPVMRYISSRAPSGQAPAAVLQALRRRYHKLGGDQFRRDEPAHHFLGMVLRWLGDDLPDVTSRGSETTIAVGGVRGTTFGAGHSPYVLLLRQLTTHTSAQAAFTEPIPRRSALWTREVCHPAMDRPFRIHLLPSWVDSSTSQCPADAQFADFAMDTSHIAGEAAVRALRAATVHSFGLVAEWAAWIYHENLDTLAAQAHPMLCYLLGDGRVNGAGLVIDALARNAYPPCGPTYSALTLAMSSAAPYRSRAAEAVAQLCAKNLLEPASFAREIAAHLADGIVKAQRIATSLGDAATICPAAGYRVTETLAALLPQLPVAAGTSKLVELLVTLSRDYGVAVQVPDALSSQTKGSSVMSVALRALANSSERGTPLRTAAATQLTNSGAYDPPAASSLA